MGRRSGLVASGPDRYGTLHHPGDQFAFDIFSQIGRALRDAGPGSALGRVVPRTDLVAIGESQSAFFLTTYINAVQPRRSVYDGFFVHSRGGERRISDRDAERQSTTCPRDC